MIIKLPPLPEPASIMAPHSRNFVGSVQAFTADQLRADRLAVAQAVREACAALCDNRKEDYWPETPIYGALSRQADAIRAIKLKEGR